MPADIEKGDIRSMKLGRTLSDAMLSLLRKNSFRKITVRDICEESLISRATFYSRFSDKYNFLQWWIIDIWPDTIISQETIYQAKEQKINQYITDNKTLLKNIFLNADSWTMDVLFDVLHSILHLKIDKKTAGAINPKYIVLSNFYIGGMLQYITWQAENDFPQDVRTMNIYLYEMIKTFQEWCQ